MNITREDMMISENIQKLHCHMIGNFYGNPFGEILDLITNEFINYWNGDCDWEQLFENLVDAGIHEDDVDRLLDPCFMTDDDIEFHFGDDDEYADEYDVECDDELMYDQLGFSMEGSI